MKALKSFRLVTILVVLGMALGFLLSGEALARHGSTIHRYQGGLISFKSAVTLSSAVSTTSTVFGTVPVGSTSVPIGPGRSALINVRYHAETRCTGPAGTWCSLRILIGGVPGEPHQPGTDGGDYAFDSSATDFFEGHAMERHMCVRNANTTSTRFVSVIAQWRVSAPGVTFRLDETSLVAERSDTCGPVELVIQ
jgi:hypothetical protein